MEKIPLNKEQMSRVKSAAAEIAGQIREMIRTYATVCVERTLLRLYGADGVVDDGTPVPNKAVDRLVSENRIESGVTRPLAAAMIETGRDAKTTAELIARGQIEIGDPAKHDPARIMAVEEELAQKAVGLLDQSRKRKQDKIDRWGLPAQPWKYMIVATGNIYEDRTQARSAVFSGADIIAVIRSTAQSLLDYIPYGPTTEGFGGTFATQENFRIMREALDEVSETRNRYVRLVNYASGLCMSEIAACAAIEDLDMLLNDSMYGVLFRDINMKRTFVDQYVSRLICSRAGIIINTGEDNYLTTSDAMESAHTVTASQLINEALAKDALLSDDLIGLGHAFEINPKIENALLYEIAHAQLARQLFPNAPLKFMPPTKYKSTNIFYSHALDTMFNLASIATNQGIHLAGILTEAIHTPLMQDRYLSLQAIDYVFGLARGLGDEIAFKPDGVIVNRARQVLDETEQFLDELRDMGLMEGIARGKFADIKRSPGGGKGLDGVFKKGPAYSNPVVERIEREGVING